MTMPSRINDWLWCGDITSLEHLHELKEQGLLMVVSCLPIGNTPCDSMAAAIRGVLALEEGLSHRILVTSDTDSSIPPEHIDHILSSPVPTLIHCNGGRNRSTMLAACWLLIHEGEPFPVKNARVTLARVMDIRRKALGLPNAVVEAEMERNFHRFAEWLEERWLG